MFGHNNNNHADTSQKKESCSCKSSQGLFMYNRQVSLMVAALIALAFCIFLGGYFLGQRNFFTTFAGKIEQESFGDQVYSAMCAMCDNGDVEESSEDEESNEAAQGMVPKSEDVDSVPQLAAQESQKQEIAREVTTTSSSLHLVQVSANPDSEGVPTESDGSETMAEASVQHDEYYAQLVGFGTARAAQQFVQRLSRKEIPVIVKKRQSRTTRGRFVSWYQVVTEKFDDKAELEALIAKLQHEEKLNDVRIIVCENAE